MNIRYSQNFLVNRELVRQLVNNSSITKNDTVIEIGPGKGIITEELANKAGHVIAIELDTKLFNELLQHFRKTQSIELVHADILKYRLPLIKYKVFSNIPFGITSDIIKKLLEATNPPIDTYIIVQKEASLKYLSKSMLAVLLKSEFEFIIIHEFKRTDFNPAPSADTVMLRIKKRETPAVKDKSLYYDFITYVYNKWGRTIQENLKDIFTRAQFTRLANDVGFNINSTPKELGFKEWLGIYDYFVAGVSNAKKLIVKGSYYRLLKNQSRITKQHRTFIKPKPVISNKNI